LSEEKNKRSSLYLPIANDLPVAGDTRKAIAPKPTGGLAPGHIVGDSVDHSVTILLCEHCDRPLFRIYPLVVLSRFSSYQKPSEAIGHNQKIPDRVGCPAKMYQCPFCKQPFAKYNEKTEGFRYKTNKGYV
jgi:hypothetical protein